MIDKSLLRVANTPETQFLLQGELKAISQGLQYKEIEVIDGISFNTYKGYVN
jgi:hypothetical protein